MRIKIKRGKDKIMKKLMMAAALTAILGGAQSVKAEEYWYNIALRDSYGLLLGHEDYTTWYVQIYDKTLGCLIDNADYYREVASSANWTGYNLRFSVDTSWPFTIKESDEFELRVFEGVSGKKTQIDTIPLPKVGERNNNALIPLAFTVNGIKMLSASSAQCVFADYPWYANMDDKFYDKWTSDEGDIDGDGVSNIDEWRAGTDPYGGALMELSVNEDADRDVGDVEPFARTGTLNCTLNAEGAVVSAKFDWSSGHTYTLRWKKSLADLGEDLPLCDATGAELDTKYFMTKVNDYNYPTGSTTIYAKKPSGVDGDYYIGLAVDGNFCKYVSTSSDAPKAQGSADNPWQIGDNAMAYTNGVGGLIISGTGKVTSTPWEGAVANVTTLQVAENITDLGGTTATLSNLASVNGLSVGAFNSAAVGVVKAGFSAIAVNPATKTATLTLVVKQAPTLTTEAKDWTVAGTTNIEVKAETPAGFFKVAK